MPRLKETVLTLSLLVIFIVAPDFSEAFFWDNDDVIAEINDIKLTDIDFKHWWNEWQEPQIPLPKTPDEFIDWILLSQEAEKMQLYENASFRKKVNVFMKVRSLMLIRQEEIAMRMLPPSDERLNDIYQEEYVPFLNLRMTALPSEEDVSTVQDLLKEGLSLQEAAVQAGFNDPSKYIEETGEMRPLKIPAPMREIALTLERGQNGGPVVWKDVFYLVELLSRRDGTDDDFESVRESLVKKHSKREDERLTKALIENLKEKYKAEIDRDFLKTLDTEVVPQGEKDRIVIKFGETEISVERLFQSMRQPLKLQKEKGMGKENFQKALDGVVNNIVSQSLIGMEALDRHYELRPPFKYTYEFYRQNRLIVELVNEIIRPQVKIEKADIIKEYEAHPERYIKQENMVELIMVDTKSEKLAEVLSDQLKAGGDFSTVMKVLAPGGLTTKKTTVEKLSAEIRDAISPLSAGQAVGPITSNGRMYFIKFIGHADPALIPLEEVAPQIQIRLNAEKYTEVRNSYLKRLKQKSKIKINIDVWKKTRSQLLEETDDQN